jgi:hypothetical protein
MPVITDQSRQMFHVGGELLYFFDRLGQASHCKPALPSLHIAVCPLAYCPIVQPQPEHPESASPVLPE